MWDSGSCGIAVTGSSMSWSRWYCSQCLVSLSWYELISKSQDLVQFDSHGVSLSMSATGPHLHWNFIDIILSVIGCFRGLMTSTPPKLPHLQHSFHYFFMAFFITLQGPSSLRLKHLSIIKPYHLRKIWLSRSVSTSSIVKILTCAQRAPCNFGLLLLALNSTRLLLGITLLSQ